MKGNIWYIYQAVRLIPCFLNCTMISKLIKIVFRINGTDVWKVSEIVRIIRAY